MPNIRARRNVRWGGGRGPVQLFFLLFLKRNYSPANSCHGVPQDSLHCLSLTLWTSPPSLNVGSLFRDVGRAPGNDQDKAVPESGNRGYHHHSQTRKVNEGAVRVRWRGSLGRSEGRQPVLGDPGSSQAGNREGST